MSKDKIYIGIPISRLSSSRFVLDKFKPILRRDMLLKVARFMSGKLLFNPLFLYSEYHKIDRHNLNILILKRHAKRKIQEQ